MNERAQLGTVLLDETSEALLLTVCSSYPKDAVDVDQPCEE